MKDTKSSAKPSLPEGAVPQHKRLAVGESVLKDASKQGASKGGKGGRTSY